jgi:tetratricopeptide (TPR) repeat protein
MFGPTPKSSVLATGGINCQHHHVPDSLSLGFQGRSPWLSLDPISPIAHNNRAMLFFRARRYDEAIGAAKEALEPDPSFVNAIWWQSVAYAGKHDYSTSIMSLERALSMSRGPVFRALLGHVYALAGERKKAFGTLEELKALSKEGYVSPVDFAIVYSGLSNADSTFEWLEIAYRARATRLLELPSMYFDNVCSDPRYSGLLKRIGIPSRATPGPYPYEIFCDPG